MPQVSREKQGGEPYQDKRGNPQGEAVKVVTYARVSTIAQETEGQSLDNQERTFQTWLKRSGATRLRAYTEAKSAKSIEGRDQFVRMIAEMPKLKPDFVVVDTVDRFTRNLQDGLSLLEQLKGHGVKLYPLERGEPIDLDNDRDWKEISQDMMAAESERRRIRTRINRSFKGRRERGATLHNRAPFGLLKQGDRLIPHPEYAAVVKQADRMYISGETLREILEYVKTTAGEKGWKSIHGVQQYLDNVEYVKAGVRSLATQEKMNERLSISRRRFGQKREYVHPMSGVFACGACVDLGHAPTDALMPGGSMPGEMRDGGMSSARIVCQGKRHTRHPNNIGVQEPILDSIFGEIFATLKANDMLLKSWESQQEMAQDNSQERLLQKRLSSIEQKESKLPSRREHVFDLLQDPDESVANQVKKMLKQLDDEESSLARDKEAVLEALASVTSPKPITVSYDLQTMLAKAIKSWPRFSNERKNEIAQSFCHAVGSNPRFYKGKGRHPVEAVVSWPEIIPSAVYRVLYGKGITPKVDLIPILQPERLPSEMPDNVTSIGLAK